MRFFGGGLLVGAMYDAGQAGSDRTMHTLKGTELNSVPGVAVVSLSQAACFGEALRSSMRLFTNPVGSVKRWDLWCAH